MGFISSEFFYSTKVSKQGATLVIGYINKDKSIFTNKKNMTIQHLVISGGANIGFPFFGIIKTLLDEAFFTMNNIPQTKKTTQTS